jgi:hypothetical protein
MKRMVLGIFVLLGLMVVASDAARQTPTTDQRLYFKIAIPRQANPVVILPRAGSSIEMSALSMDREDASEVMHLKGDAEIRFEIGSGRSAVIRTDEALYDIRTAQIRMLSEFRMTEEAAQR